MKIVSLDAAASARSCVASMFSLIATLPRYVGFVRVDAIAAAIFGSCAHSFTSLPQRAATIDIAVPNEPAPMIEIFNPAPSARPSFAPDHWRGGGCSSDV